MTNRRTRKIPLAVGIVCIVASALPCREASASATVIPEFRWGSCGTGAGAPACVWPCNDGELFGVDDLRCPCDDGVPGETCRQDGDCTSGSCPACRLDPSEVFVGHLVIEADDSQCAGQGGARLTIGLRGSKQDGSADFEAVTKVIDLCGVDATCDHACATDCVECEPDTCPASQCGPTECTLGSCPPLSTFLCEFSGLGTTCPDEPAGQERICEADLVESDVLDWLRRGRQPLLRLVGAELTGPGGPFESESGPAVVVATTVGQLVDNTSNAAPSEARSCVKVWFLRDPKSYELPSPIATAVDGAAACGAVPGCTLTVPDMGTCNADLRICGDGVIDPGEGCDDGNTAPGDGCDATCQVEPGFGCTGEPSVCTPLPTPTPSATPTPQPGALDHFTCYKAGASRGSVKFPGIPIPPGVDLVDQFGASTVQVKKPKFLCAPTNKLGEDPTAPAHPEHLEGYQIKNPTRPPLPTNLRVVDQFNPGGLIVDAKKQSHLLVPTAKSRSAPPPLPGAFSTDHFQCYKAKTSKGTPRFEPLPNVELEDQFGTIHVLVKKPKYLCLPVDKNGEDPTAPTHADHLLCYQIKQLKTEPKFEKVRGVFVHNQFGQEQLDVRKPTELCVPALKNP